MNLYQRSVTLLHTYNLLNSSNTRACSNRFVHVTLVSSTHNNGQKLQENVKSDTRKLLKRYGTTIYCSPHQLWTCRHQYRHLSRCFTASCGSRRLSAVCIPLLAHNVMSSHKNINAPKLDYCDSLWWTGRKRRAGASEALTCCAVTLIPSNSNDTASATGTGSAEAS